MVAYNGVVNFLMREIDDEIVVNLVLNMMNKWDFENFLLDDDFAVE